MPTDDVYEPDDQGVAEDGDAGAVGQTRKTSRSARYKAQRDRALAALRSMEARQSALESKLDQVLTSIQKDEPKGDPSDPWSGMSDQELMAIVNSPEQMQENPTLVNTALVKLNERKIQRAIQQAKEELSHDVASKLTRKDALQEIRARITDEFGPEAFDPDGELFQLASAKYAEYEQRYGSDKISGMPDYVYFSYEQAARELGVEPSQHQEPEPETPSDVSSNPVAAALTSRRRVRPDASDLTVSRSDGHAERASEIQSLARKGDTAGVFRSAIRQLFSPE